MIKFRVISTLKELSQDNMAQLFGNFVSFFPLSFFYISEVNLLLLRPSKKAFLFEVWYSVARRIDIQSDSRDGRTGAKKPAY